MNYNRDIKVFKEWELVKRIAYNFTLAIFITLVLFILSVNIFNLRIDEVLSDSMYPVFSQKDIIIILPQDDYKVGDIVEYYKQGESGDGMYVTHEIVAYDKESDTYTLKGAGNSTEDPSPIARSAIIGKEIMIWRNGRETYAMIKKNYPLILALVIGCWGLSTIISGEREMRVHDITKD